MTTTRERREARVARLDEWADRREAKADAGHDRASALASVIPFGQPILAGHHSQGRDTRYRERIAGTMDRAVADRRKAEEMRAKARNIACAADRAIYNDDADVIPAIEARIAGLEAERDRWKAYNAACRKAGKPTPEAVALLDASQQRTLESMGRAGQVRSTGAAPAYATANLSGNIKRYRDRLSLARQTQEENTMTTTTEPTTAPEAERPTTPEKAPRAKGRTDVTYYHDGKAMPGSHKHKLSTLAYFHSHDLDTKSPKRISTKEFVQVLAAAGIDKPGEPGWSVKLPNGVTVECRLDGEPSTYDGPAPTRKASASKAAAKSKPAKVTARATKETAKARAAKKAPAKKATASRQVTPIPKASTARSSRAN